MISPKMADTLTKNIKKCLNNMTFDAWIKEYPTAFEILCGEINSVGQINGRSPVIDLGIVTHRMYRLAGSWTWQSGARNDLLKGTQRGTEYDCHTISCALAKLFCLLGYSKHSYEDCIKKFPQGDVYWLEYDNGNSVVVLPKHHFNSQELLKMPDGTVGEDSCDRYFAWTDHRFVVINNRVYDAMLDVAGIEQDQIKNQYVEWLGEVRDDKGAPNGFYWKANKKDKSNIFFVNGEKTFEDPRMKQLRFSRSAPFIKSIGGN